MPAFIEPQLCDKAGTPPLDSDRKKWGHEVKWDGDRCQLRAERGKVQLHSRGNINVTRKFLPIAQAAQVLPDCILDGEVIALDRNNNPSFLVLRGISEKLRRPTLRYCAFDVLMLKGEDLRELPYVKRKATLQDLLKKHQAPDIFFVKWFPPHKSLFAIACNAAMEGIVAKQLDAPYRSGRNRSWVKVKCPRRRRTAPAE